MFCEMVLNINLQDMLDKTQDVKHLRKVRKDNKKFYFLKNEAESRIASEFAVDRINKMLLHLNNTYQQISNQTDIVLQRVMKFLTPIADINNILLWDTVSKWVTMTRILPDSYPLLGSILNTLCSSKVIKAENSRKGTQLKLLLTLEGGQFALFKPQWYQRNEIIKGPVYSGKDRHNAEVAAFHLSLLLNLHRVPLTVGRKMNLRHEILPVAAPTLKKTFYQSNNNTCFYGQCFYCSSKDPVCAHGDIIEGALILWLPGQKRFARYASPWQRTYKTTFAARWEMEKDYCNRVKQTQLYSLNTTHSRNRLLDLIDAAIFDFLIDNGDRHHYEIPVGAKPASVFLFDNGKSFGDPNVDHVDILAPFYQCCIIRKTTWTKLLQFTGGFLSYALNMTLSTSHIVPVLTKEHLQALDRRLLLIFATGEICFHEHGLSEVLLI